MKTPLLAASVALAACACQSIEPTAYAPPRTPQDWLLAAPGAAQPTRTPVALESDPAPAWWKELGDPLLDVLVERALEHNLDLEQAAGALREARALRAASGAVLDPQVELQAGLRRVDLGQQFAAQTLLDLGFDASWEIDWFGANQAQLDAALASELAVEERRRDLLVSLLGELARNYVELRGEQAQIALTEANLVNQGENARLERLRVTAGLQDELDLLRAEALESSTAARLPSSHARVEQLAHRIALLCGEEPNALLDLLRAPLAGGALLPRMPDSVAVGLPAQLLRRRPDLRAMQRVLEREALLVGVAQSELWPRLVLNGSIGVQSEEWSSLNQASSRIFSFGPNLSLPIFDRDRLEDRVQAQEQRAQQAWLAWRAGVLDALAEVQDALSALEYANSRLGLLEASLVSARRAVDIATERNLRGLIDFFQVLDAQRVVLQTESELAATRTQALQNLVALYKALGGGWEEHEFQP